MNVKTGDLAIVIHASNLENVGIICKVVEYLGAYGYSGCRVENAWGVESIGRSFQHIFPNPIASLRAAVSDRNLRPISGIPDPEQIDTDTPIDCEVLT